MSNDQLLKLLAAHPGVRNLAEALSDSRNSVVCADGLVGSSAALYLSALCSTFDHPLTFIILDDEEEAGYFYHDMTQMLGDSDVLFFPSAYKTTLKSNRHDPANEILRTDILSRLSTLTSNLIIITYPEAVKEQVVSRQNLTANTLLLKKGETYDLKDLAAFLVQIGFSRTDYVYEPGQFAVRGSIVDIFSFSSEEPYRIDFFGDDIDSIRSFDVQSQLSKERFDSVTIVANVKVQTHDDEGDTSTILEFLPADTLLVCKDLKFVEDKTELSFTPYRKLLLSRSSLTSLNHLNPLNPLNPFHTTRQSLFHKNFDLIREEFQKFTSQGYKINICASDEKQHKRLKEIFPEFRLIPVHHAIHSGFTDHDLKICFFTDHQIFDRFHRYSLKSDKARHGKMVLTLKELQQFEIGDYVVHIDHGIGRFGGLVRIPNAGTMEEKIMISYKDGGTVYVSIHALHKIAKYKGKEGEAPALSRLGTGAWARMKERVKAKVKDIARDLIRLYAKRHGAKGFAFSMDGYMQHELEGSFMYEDTPDQFKATQEVKADMEKPVPMDRLICGDVGFGKTEVAVRAAFKAAVDGKQVAVLVPTTVLAYQHFQTFSDRLKDFPVTIDYLSRARTAKDVKTILSRLSEGKIDIVIGTHKLIGKDVRFKDLGLLIIDEEQKFGVSVKEKLRQMKVNVDTLTMTATPIPRTLQFSLMGARDLSIIQTPPSNRYPIQTEIQTFSPEIIAEAINFEMNRGGQVFFINNRISDLGQLEDLIHRYVPDARVCVGHGRMTPSELEKVVFDFMNYDYDVMLSTTIIENGIDIPNANTIIINAAQNYGLSDLHQMRGRVGRSNRKAFCYLLAPPMTALSDDARRRLRALETFSDLGMGVQIAMQDLDIRGAGNLLGSEQSGFIADLGYETYQKVLKEAMSELRREQGDGQNVEQGKLCSQVAGSREQVAGTWVDEVTIESDLAVYFPEEYVPSSGERISLYRELDGLQDEDPGALSAFIDRLKDRFGPVPPSGLELIDVIPLKWAARRLGIERITLKSGKMIMYMLSDFQSRYYDSPEFFALIGYATQHPRDTKLRDESQRRSLTILSQVTSVHKALQVLQSIVASSCCE